MSSNGIAAQSVLVHVGLDRLGDSLLKLPFVRALRQAYPAARITWLAGKETSVYAGIMAPLVEGLLDEVIENGGVGKRPSELLRRPLPGRGFDLILDTQRIVWTTLSLKRIGHRAFVSPAARFLLSDRRPPAGYRYPRAMLRQMLDLLELATGTPVAAPRRLTLDIADDDRVLAARLLPEGTNYVGVAPGAGGLPKCWPRERFVAVARAQVARNRVPVFLLGPSEVDWRGDLAAAVPEARFPLQDPSVPEDRRGSPFLTMALAGRLRVGLANDAGPAHLMAVGGAPLVALYGPTVAEKFRPLTDRLTVLRATDFGGREMTRIPVEPVIEALERAVAGG